MPPLLVILAIGIFFVLGVYVYVRVTWETRGARSDDWQTLARELGSSLSIDNIVSGQLEGIAFALMPQAQAMEVRVASPVFGLEVNIRRQHATDPCDTAWGRVIDLRTERAARRRRSVTIQVIVGIAILAVVFTICAISGPPR